MKNAEWNIVINHLEPDLNYSFNVVALTCMGPSERKVINEMTAPSGNLTPLQLGFIYVGAVVGLIFIVFGIYSCYRSVCVKH